MTVDSKPTFPLYNLGIAFSATLMYGGEGFIIGASNLAPELKWLLLGGISLINGTVFGVALLRSGLMGSRKK